MPPFSLSNMNISKDTGPIFKFYLNKNKNGDPLRAARILKRMEMGHTAVSATEASSLTLQIWQHGAKMNYCYLLSTHQRVDYSKV